jgi:hypothetical protein
VERGPSWICRRLPSSNGGGLSCQYRGSSMRRSARRCGCTGTGCGSIRVSRSCRSAARGALFDINPPDAELDQAAGDRCRRVGGVSSEASAELKPLRKENAELRRANEILRTRRHVGGGLLLRLHLARFVNVAFATDVFSQRILRWSVGSTKTTRWCPRCYSRPCSPAAAATRRSRRPAWCITRGALLTPL